MKIKVVTVAAPRGLPDELLASLAIGMFLMRGSLSREVRQILDEIDRRVYNAVIFGENAA